MKSTVRIFLLLLACLIVSTAAAHGQTRWVLVYSTAAAKINADSTSIVVESDGSHQIWLNWHWPRSRKDTPGSASYIAEKTLVQVKCSPVAYRTMHWVDYDKDGNVVASGDQPAAAWSETIVPDSIGEVLFKNLCAFFDGRPFSPTGEPG